MTDFCDKDMWPPSSPDLNPMDFAIWSILETDVCATPHSSTANLKRTLQTAWSNLDESAVRRSCLSAVLRFEAVVKAKGGHIEWCYCRLDIHMFMNICTKNQLIIFANNRNIWKNRSVNLSAPPCKFTPASIRRPIWLRNRRQVLANMVFYNRAMISVVLVLGGVSAL